MGDADTSGMPVYLELERRPAVIIGGNDDAAAFASTLLVHGASVTVVACAASLELHSLAASDRIALVSRAYVRGDLAGAFFAACFESGEAATAVAAEASAERCLVIVAGHPELSTVRLVECACPTDPAEEPT